MKINWTLVRFKGYTRAKKVNMGLVYTIAKKVGMGLVCTKANKVDIDLVHTRAATIDIVSFALESINGSGL